jgi:uncharacterized Rmd1/YagE family protein
MCKPENNSCGKTKEWQTMRKWDQCEYVMDLHGWQMNLFSTCEIFNLVRIRKLVRDGYALFEKTLSEKLSSVPFFPDLLFKIKFYQITILNTLINVSISEEFVFPFGCVLFSLFCIKSLWVPTHWDILAMFPMSKGQYFGLNFFEQKQ